MGIKRPCVVRLFCYHGFQLRSVNCVTLVLIVVSEAREVTVCVCMDMDRWLSSSLSHRDVELEDFYHENSVCKLCYAMSFDVSVRRIDGAFFVNVVS